ncbi:MAG: DinB family protein [Candidatus Angelobacter sp.]
MANRLRSLIFVYTAASLLLTSSVGAVAQKAPPEPKTISDSINFIWKDVEHDFTALAEAMPEDKWSFKPTQGEFKNVRTFAEQVKHVACGNEAWAKQMSG